MKTVVYIGITIVVIFAIAFAYGKGYELGLKASNFSDAENSPTAPGTGIGYSGMTAGSNL